MALFVQLDARRRFVAKEVLSERANGDYLVRWQVEEQENNDTASSSESRDFTHALWMSSDELSACCPQLCSSVGIAGPSMKTADKGEAKTVLGEEAGHLREDVMKLVSRCTSQHSVCSNQYHDSNGCHRLIQRYSVTHCTS